MGETVGDMGDTVEDMGATVDRGSMVVYPLEDTVVLVEVLLVLPTASGSADICKERRPTPRS